MLELLAVAVPMPPAPPVPVALLLDVLVPLAPPAPPAPPAPVLELVLVLDPLLVLVLDPLLDEEPVPAPPSGVHGVQGAPGSVTPQICGASHLLPVQAPLQQSLGAAHVSPTKPQWLEAFTPAMHTPVVEGSVRSTIVALSAFGGWQR